ncbi:OmpH family outer membrane protein [Candidatus Pelagibacter sp.]|jgi:outer membrane protein|nr:OmpH family outer membrane protein [Candidatus Pelagibacter sp.]
MKKLLLTVCFSIFFLNNTGVADTKIAFIDIDKIMSTSKSGSSILKQLRELNDKNIKYLQKEQKIIKDKENKIISQKNILSNEEYASSVGKIRQEIDNYNKNKTKIISDFNKLKSTNTNKLLSLITPILTKYSEEKSLSVIFRKKDILIGKIELDISDEIIIIIDNEIKEFKIK